MKVNWTGAFQIAAVYVGTVVGAGFATGKEIVEFFSQYGFYGLLAIGLTGYLLIAFGIKVMCLAANIGATSYQEVNNYLFGNRFGMVINIVLLFMLLGVSAVMLAGAGAVFEEQLQLPKSVGILFTLALAAVVMVVGMKGIFIVNVFVVPMMITFSLILLVLSLRLPHFTEAIVSTPQTKDGWIAAFMPFTFTAFNLSMAQAVLVPMAGEIRELKTIRWGGFLGGIALTIILFSSHITLVMLPNFETYEIPMAVVTKKLAASLYWIFILVIYGEIFTSIIGNVFGVERQLKNLFGFPKYVVVLSIFIIIYTISQIHYGQLLSFLYPLFGYMSLIFILLLWLRPVSLNDK